MTKSTTNKKKKNKDLDQKVLYKWKWHHSTMLALCAQKCRLGLHSPELDTRVPLKESKPCQRHDIQLRQRGIYHGGWVTGEYAVFHTILGQVGPGEMLRQELV